MNPIISDYECSICLSILINPFKTPCNHTFCQHCLKEIFELNNSHVTVCPICRSQIMQYQLKEDSSKIQIVSTYFKEQYDKRLKEITDFFNKYTTIKFLYGNTHKNIQTSDYNTHEWVLFIRLENENIEKYVEKIQISLHPTFFKPEITLIHAPFQIKRTGWGVFDIPIKIYWKEWVKQQPFETTHFLSFDGEGEEKTFKLKIENI